MTCPICGSQFDTTLTSLPFKVGDERIVILKNVPVLQCRNCPEHLIEDAVMGRIDAILRRVDANAEPEGLSYPASSLSA